MIGSPRLVKAENARVKQGLEYPLNTRALRFYAAEDDEAAAADGDSDCSGWLVLCTLTSYTQMRAWPLTRVDFFTFSILYRFLPAPRSRSQRHLLNEKSFFC